MGDTKYPKGLYLAILEDKLVNSDITVDERCDALLDKLMNKLDKDQQTVIKELFINNKTLKEIDAEFGECYAGTSLFLAMVNLKNDEYTDMIWQIAGSENCSELKIEDMNLSVRTFNALSKAGFKIVRDFKDCTYEQLYSIKNLGRKSLDELLDKLRQYGIVIEREW